MKLRVSLGNQKCAGGGLVRAALAEDRVQTVPQSGPGVRPEAHEFVPGRDIEHGRATELHQIAALGCTEVENLIANCNTTPGHAAIAGREHTIWQIVQGEWRVSRICAGNPAFE